MCNIGQVIPSAAKTDGDHPHAKPLHRVIERLPLRFERPREVFAAFPEFLMRRIVTSIHVDVSRMTLFVSFNKVIHDQPPQYNYETHCIDKQEGWEFQMVMEKEG